MKWFDHLSAGKQHTDFLLTELLITLKDYDMGRKYFLNLFLFPICSFSYNLRD